MNSTNRFLNRSLVFVVGLVLLIAGAVIAVGALLPGIQQPVDDGAKEVTGPTADALSGGQPWILWVAAAVALVIIVLLLWFVFRQGHGRTGTLFTADDMSVIIDAKVAEQLLEDALAQDPGVVSVDVVAFRIKRQNVLRVTAQARRGVSPVDVRARIDSAIAQWDSLLGTEVPIVVQIVGGLRSQLSNTSRVV